MEFIIDLICGKSTIKFNQTIFEQEKCDDSYHQKTFSHRRREIRKILIKIAK